MQVPTSTRIASLTAGSSDALLIRHLPDQGGRLTPQIKLGAFYRPHERPWAKRIGRTDHEIKLSEEAVAAVWQELRRARVACAQRLRQHLLEPRLQHSESSAPSFACALAACFAYT
eukprot:2137731-Pleurochrysis_carterae.AAC.3